MTFSTEVLLQKLGERGNWSPVRGGFEIYHNGTKRHMSDAELEVLHPALPNAIRLLCTRHVVASLRVTKLLQILKCPLHLRGKNGAMVAVEQLSEMRVLASSVSFSVSGYSYLLFDHDTGGDRCIVPDGDAPRKVAVDRDWLDVAYPGWYPRFLAASTLECALEVVIENVFCPPVACGSTVPPNDLSL